MEDCEFCPEAVAAALAQQGEAADLILCGQMAAMAESGQVPYDLSRHLGWPVVAGVEEMAWENDALRMIVRKSSALVKMTVRLPLVGVVGNCPAVLRAATLRQRMANRGKTAEITEVSRVSAPNPQLIRPQMGRSCTMLDPEKPETLSLIRRLMTQQERPAQQTACPASPGLTILPDTAEGRMEAVQLAKRTGAGLQFGGELLDITPDAVTVRTAVCGGNLHWIKNLSLPLVMTAADAPPREERTQPAWITEEQILEEAAPNRLPQAATAVICGCGMGSRASCDRARQLAQDLGAGFGLTRPAALNAWGRPNEIVGQSGAALRCTCCLVLGAAGAGAFVQGIERAETVIAVNTDPHALIFQHADYGLLMDAGTLVRKLLEGGDIL